LNKENKIPIVESEGMDELHFGSIGWKLPTPNSTAFFHINKIEEYAPKLLFPLPPHRKTVFDLIFLTNGKSIRTKGLNQFEFGKNEFFFLPAYQITTHEYMSEDAKGYFLHFDAVIFKNLGHEKHLNRFSFLQYQSNPIVSVPQELNSTVLNIFRRLEEIYLSKKIEDYSVVVYYLLTMFNEIAEFESKESVFLKNAASIIASKYKEALTEHIYQKQQVSAYAELLNVTPNHLNKSVKKVTGKSAQAILNEMLILEAKSLLKYSDLQIAEVAVRLCNQNPSNFSRFFKSQTGMSPKAFQLQ
jgi:AraC family transcriptional regulator, transcriptional activator of pobA